MSETVQSLPTGPETALLNRILASREFAHAHMLKGILWFLVERAIDPEAAAPKEYEIAVEAMGRPSSFDPRSDPIVRVSLASIRARLVSYFALEGRNEPVRLTIPKGQYAVVFERDLSSNTPGDAELVLQPVQRFWQSPASEAGGTVIVYTEPLFFRDDAGHYVRDWHTNDIEGENHLREWLPTGALAELHASYHYLSAGEVNCMLSLSRMFQELNVPVETRNSRRSSLKELRHYNLILLGSPRTNAFLTALQGDEPFAIDSERILNRKPKGNEPLHYEGVRRLDGCLMRMTEYALVTRRPGISPGRAVTMIAANHGRAIEGAGHFLTMGDKVHQVIEDMGLRDSEELPSRFQLLIRVETMDIDDEVIEVKCIATRILDQ
ncbi:MAG: hypothetical protein IT168_20480 [Bryobacterales bacterium]|nr:hypothetical protein [Bryobacterales bacterium]